jgi:hypothetical protein
VFNWFSKKTKKTVYADIYYKCLNCGKETMVTTRCLPLRNFRDCECDNGEHGVAYITRFETREVTNV